MYIKQYKTVHCKTNFCEPLVSHIGQIIEEGFYRREGKGPGCCLRAECILFLPAHAILQQDDTKKKINCTRTI